MKDFRVDSYVEELVHYYSEYVILSSLEKGIDGRKKANVGD